MKLIDLSEDTSEHLLTAVQLRGQEKLEVRLYGIPSAGYLWEVSSLPEALRFIEETGLDGSKKPPGAGAVDNFFFQAGSDCRGSLKLIYQRPWLAGKEEPLRTCVININSGSDN